MSTEELTTSEAATRLGESDRLVRLWCKQGRFPNAHLVTHPRGDYWSIPAGDLQTFVKPRPGPVPRVDKAAPGSNGKVVVKKSPRTAKRK